MFSHRQVWAAIEALAQQNDMSVSRLARNAGLDATTFNKSKRVAADGRERWPSTESLAKIMAATNTSIQAFTDLMLEDRQSFNQKFRSLERIDGISDGGRSAQAIPLLGLAEAGAGGFFDDAGFPSGHGWDEVHFPTPDIDNAYALEISGDSMLPLYRDGDRIIVSPNAAIRRGDRVVVRTVGGEVMAKVLTRQTANLVELTSLNPDHEPRQFSTEEIDWIARIVWASQ